jgi:hypothetical protein
VKSALWQSITLSFDEVVYSVLERVWIRMCALWFSAVAAVVGLLNMATPQRHVSGVASLH